jgi:hypothetical protein
MFFPVILPCAPNLTKIILGICLTAQATDVQILHINPVIGQQLAFQGGQKSLSWEYCAM